MNFSIDLPHSIFSFQSNSSFEQPQHSSPATQHQQNCNKNSFELENKKERVPYRWQPSQHKKYINFLIQRRELFEMSLQRRIVTGIHNLMSKYIENRTSLQCRSHHQKMLVKYKTIDNIISAHQHLFQSTSRDKLNEFNQTRNDALFDSKIERGEISFLQDIFTFGMFPQKTSEEALEDGMVQVQSYPYNESFGLDFQ